SSPRWSVRRPSARAPWGHRPTMPTRVPGRALRKGCGLGGALRRAAVGQVGLRHERSGAPAAHREELPAGSQANRGGTSRRRLVAGQVGSVGTTWVTSRNRADATVARSTFLEFTSLAVKDEDRRRARTAVEVLQGLAISNHPLAGEVAQRLEA